MQSAYYSLLNMNLSKYEGMWVVIIKDKVIGSSKTGNLREIIDIARKDYPKEKPLITKVSLNTLQIV